MQIFPFIRFRCSYPISFLFVVYSYQKVILRFEEFFCDVTNTDPLLFHLLSFSPRLLQLTAE